MKSEEGEVLAVGGDHIAQVGSGDELREVRGRYGLWDNTNAAGEDLVERCQLNGKALANTFSPHNRRGTWFDILRAHWYELEGFPVKKKDQRHRIKRGIKVLEETVLKNFRTNFLI